MHRSEQTGYRPGMANPNGRWVLPENAPPGMQHPLDFVKSQYEGLHPLLVKDDKWAD
jgi:hypothetical protein